MIIDLGRDIYKYSFLICLKNRIEEHLFLKRAKVNEGTYAGDLVKRLYDRVLNCSLDLKADYETYFKLEYEGFYNYLDKRYLFDEDIKKQLCKLARGHEHIILYNASYSFLEDEYGLEFLKNLFEPRRTR